MNRTRIFPVTWLPAIASIMLAVDMAGPACAEIPRSALSGGPIQLSSSAWVERARQQEAATAAGVTAPKDAVVRDGMSRPRCEFLRERDLRYWGSLRTNVTWGAVLVLGLGSYASTDRPLMGLMGAGVGGLVGYGLCSALRKGLSRSCDEIEWGPEEARTWEKFKADQSQWLNCLMRGRTKRMWTIWGWALGASAAGAVVGAAAGDRGKTGVTAAVGAAGGFLVGELIGVALAEDPPFGCGDEPEIRE